MADNSMLDDLFQDILAAERERAQNASGDSPRDFRYDRAESVRKYGCFGFVKVTYNGKEYGPARMTGGALDADPNKSTALVQIEGKWYKLWFFDSEIE